MLGRWFTASHHRGYMLVETEDATSLFRWVSEETDIMDFSIEPVVADDEAAPILAEQMKG